MGWLDNVKWENGAGLDKFREAISTISAFAWYIQEQTCRTDQWMNPELDVKSIYFMSLVIDNYTDDLTKGIDRMMNERKAETAT